VTLVSQTHAPDDVYGELRGQFSEEGLVKLTVAVAAIQRLEPHRDQLPRGSSVSRSARGLSVMISGVISMRRMPPGNRPPEKRTTG
jgi:hypothetical protein